MLLSLSRFLIRSADRIQVIGKDMNVWIGKSEVKIMKSIGLMILLRGTPADKECVRTRSYKNTCRNMNVTKIYRSRCAVYREWN